MKLTQFDERLNHIDQPFPVVPLPLSSTGIGQPAS